MAGGVGSRMGDLVRDVPKPMVLLAGKPIMEHQIDLAGRYGLTEIHVLTGHKAEVLESYFGDGSQWGVQIVYHREKEPLGTAGAVKQLEGTLDQAFVVFYGDVLMDVDLPMLMDFHRAKAATATIAVHPNDHPFDSDLVEVDGNDRVLAVHNKPHDPKGPRRNLVSAALYVLSPSVFPFIERGRSSDFGRDVFPRLLASGGTISAYNTRDYIKDVGTVQRLREVEADLIAGRPRRFNRGSAIGAVFLDRDGVLNQPVEPLHSAGQVRLLPGVASAVRRLNRSSRLSVVVTNQPLVAKGFASEDDLEAIHGKLEGLLSEGGAYLDRIYYCPHHPERGHQGERAELKIECDCRKPATGMIDRAVSELNIDLLDSFMVGDRTVDIQAGINAGIGTILVRTGVAGRDGISTCESDFIFDDLSAAVDFLHGSYPPLLATVDGLLTSQVVENRIIAIGGLSRSGKTTLAGVLAVALRGRGIRVKRLSLDHWVLGLGSRETGMGVRERYQYALIEDALKQLSLGETIEFEPYDPVTREPSGVIKDLTLEGGEVLIVDGVVGLDIPGVRDASTLRLYAEVSESVRRDRFGTFYEDKGLSAGEIDELYDERRVDEEPVVLDSRRFADAIIDVGAMA